MTFMLTVIKNISAIRVNVTYVNWYFCGDKCVSYVRDLILLKYRYAIKGLKIMYLPIFSHDWGISWQILESLTSVTYIVVVTFSYGVNLRKSSDQNLYLGIWTSLSQKFQIEEGGFKKKKKGTENRPLWDTSPFKTWYRPDLQK